MKNWIYLLGILIFLGSCEKSDNPVTIKTGFDFKILDNYFITSIAFDHEGSAWIGTFRQGLIKYSSKETIVYNSTNSLIPDSSVIYDIDIDSKGNIWIGCNGLVKYDGNSFIYYNSQNSDIPEDFVESIAIDSKDNIWFTSCRFRQGGIVRYDGNNWTVYTPDNSDLPVNSVKSIAIDKNDNVWLALNEIVNHSYLVKITGNDWKTFTNDDLGFSPYYFGNIRINSKNELCGAIDYSLSSTISNSGPQVFKFDGVTSEQLQYDPVSNIKSITVDNLDNIWCLKNGGYAVYSGQKWILDDTSFKVEGVFAIEQALNNKIWIGTGDGIYIKN